MLHIIGVVGVRNGELESPYDAQIVTEELVEDHTVEMYYL
jgi:hypothetical protein